MCEDQVIQGIAGGIFAIVGILLAISGGNLWGRKPKWSIALGITLSGVGLFMLITSFPQYAIGFSVLATLALAFAAFLTIKEADAREERRREEELAKEKRNRKERLLNEIIEWATDVARLNFKILNMIEAQTSKPSEESRLDSSNIEVVSQFQVVEEKGEYIKSVVLTSFNEGNKLIKAVNAVNKEIRKYVELSIKRFEDKVTTEELAEHMQLLRNKVTKLLKESAKIKTKGIR